MENKQIKQVEDYSNIVLTVNKGIIYVADKPSEEFIKELTFPENLTITVEGRYVKILWLHSGDRYSEILEYKNLQFKEVSLKPRPGKQLLRIFYDVTRLTIEVI